MKDYKRLGDYIHEVDVRNASLSVNTLLGVSITKEFISSIANTIGTDMSTYKIVHKDQFAYGPVTSRNGDKVSIALLNNSDIAIISQAYTVFEVKDNNELLPDYLMMWFRRPEFDRYARFHSHGSAREIFDWSELCDVLLPVPSIERQREIVAEYETISKRIKSNEQFIATLETTAQTLYRKMFVEGIDKENLPEGWRMGTISDFCQEIKSGGTPSRVINSYWGSRDYRWLKTGEVHKNVVIDTEEYISKEGLKNSSAKLIPVGSITMAMYGATAAQIAYIDCETTTNQACCNMVCYTKNDAAYLYFHLLVNQEDIKKLANGGAQENLSQELICQQTIIIFDDDTIKTMFSTILNDIILRYRENKKLTELQSLLLARMGK